MPHKQIAKKTKKLRQTNNILMIHKLKGFFNVRLFQKKLKHLKQKFNGFVNVLNHTRVNNSQIDIFFCIFASIKKNVYFICSSK